MSALNGPEHPKVQSVATTLIDCYVAMGNFVDAGRFARINYECLSDPNSKTDRKSDVFALAKKQLAGIWILTPADQRDQGPEVAEEAETLMREACDILEKGCRRSCCIISLNGLYRPVLSDDCKR